MRFVVRQIFPASAPYGRYFKPQRVFDIRQTLKLESVRKQLIGKI
jgi:hypothetical protein